MQRYNEQKSLPFCSLDTLNTSLSCMHNCNSCLRGPLPGDPAGFKLFEEKRREEPRSPVSGPASTKSHASSSGKIKNRSFRVLRMRSDVFFDADSESPHMT